MRFLRHSMMGLFLAALSAGLLAYALNTISDALQTRMAEEPRAPQARERVFAVTTVTAQPATVRPVLETYGTIEARRRLELRAAVAGRIVELSEAFVDGGEVRAGEVLVRIDPAQSQAAVDRLSADLQDAQAEQRDAARSLDLARDEQAAAEDQADLRARAFNRQSDLGARGVGTSAAIEEAELAAAAARANVLARRQAVAQAEARVDLAQTQRRRAEIELTEARRDLADTTVTARFDGILNETSGVAGGLVSVNERLGDLVDPHALEVAFRVSTAQYARLIGGQGTLISAPVTVSLDVADVDLAAEGVLARVDAATGQGQTGRVLFADLDSAAGFRPGDFVRVAVREPPLEDVIRLPAAALGADGYVLAVTADNRLEPVAATLLRRQGDDVLVEGAGLAGREVVSARTPLLGPGIAVRPQRTTEQSAFAPPGMLRLSDARRARLITFIDADQRMPQADKARVRAQLAGTEVPAPMVARLERRMGG